jgi:hypothetical protein
MEDIDMSESRYHDSFEGKRQRGSKVIKVIGLVLAGLCVASLFALIFGFILKWLWNWLMPEIFGLPVITYWQAFGLVMLSKILFSGFGHHPKEHISGHFHGKVFDGKGTEAESNGCRHFERWKNYGRFWHEEGGKVFNDWLERTKTNDARREEEPGDMGFEGKKT